MLIQDIQNGEPSKYLVRFKLRCFNPESRVHILLTYLPEIKDFLFEYLLDDEEFQELENMLQTIGIEFRQLVKIPFIEEEQEEGIPEVSNKALARVFDELCSTREDIIEIHKSEMNEEKKNREIEAKAKNFHRASEIFIEYLKKEINGD